jgi:hypothetical protein
MKSVTYIIDIEDGMWNPNFRDRLDPDFSEISVHRLRNTAGSDEVGSMLWIIFFHFR